MPAVSEEQFKKSYIRSFFTAPMMLLASIFMSRHAKRLFYFASLYASLLPLESLKSDVLGRLNKLMNLASCDDAMVMPAVLSRAVWGNIDVVHYIPTESSNDVAADVCAYKLVSLIPHWMKFGTIDEMKDDTLRFFNSVKLLQESGELKLVPLEA